MKGKFWSADWLFSLIVVLIFLVLSVSPPLQGIERSAYDLGVNLTEREPNPDIKIVAIDDQSIANLGRWPWSRDIHAALIDKIAEGKPKLIVSSIFFVEPQSDAGQQAFAELGNQLANSTLASLPDIAPTIQEHFAALQADAAILSESAKAQREALISALTKEDADGVLQAPDPLPDALPELDTQVVTEVDSLLTEFLVPEAQALMQLVNEQAQALDHDAALAGAMAASGNVLLADFFELGQLNGRPDNPLPDYVDAQAVPAENVADTVGAAQEGWLPIPAKAAIYPIELLGTVAAGIGHMNSDPDVDGAIRYEPLVLDYFGQYFPSLALTAAAKSLNLDMKDVRVNLGESVQVGRLTIRTDNFSRMRTFFYADRGDQPAFDGVSVFDVLTDKVKPSIFKDKIVLIGPTATGVGSPQVTPVSTTTPPVVALAHSVSSILNEDFYIEPEWALSITLAAYLLVALILILLIPRLKAGTAALLTLGLASALIGSELYLMSSETIWLRMAIPTTMLLVGYGLLTTKRFLVTERGKLKVEGESAESNKMLALQYQGQGQLDMAFEKLQRIPLDDSIMGVLYNLALDFESKRKPAKARSVYEHMMQHDPKYKDIAQRIDTAKNMEATVILGGGGGGHAGGTMILDGGAQKPTLGRYDVEKELGKGAMGVVYLGRDPKINREVAIKTMALSDEFEGEELEEAKSRFFREAESAGRLNHPNIVTIFDAGEEHDLAFIAMEFLKGREMTEFTKPDNLLSIEDVLTVIADCADALSYAHGNNVVHRDIKPANVMYEPELTKAKITDFGIARVTDSSKTKTGMVLGTPSFMSPEQLAGKKVDGRSDLFSLGVMMYQLLTGKLPFTGDSMATLMYKIANEDHPDILDIRADLPACVKAVVDKSLSKDLDGRYANGAEMARDARACKDQLAGAAVDIEV